MDELNEKLREQGIEKMADVKAAYLEGDGQISVIRNSARSQRLRTPLQHEAGYREVTRRAGAVERRICCDEVIPVARPAPGGQPDLHMDAVFTHVARRPRRPMR